MMLVDISMLMRRCHAKMDFLKTTEGVPTGLEFGTLRTLEMLEKKYPDELIVLCFDSPVNARKQISSDYKSNRAPLSDDYKDRYKAFKMFLQRIYANIEVRGYEADDLMYSLSKTESFTPHYIYTNDDDLLQAVDDKRNVKVLKSWNSKLFIWDEKKVFEKWGVLPRYLPILRAFIGDGSDNLKGVERIDKKYLKALINWGVRQNLSITKMLEEIATADWSDSMKPKVRDFINSGKWMENYDLMCLMSNDKLKICSPVPNEDKYIVECLNKWEIMSLRLCEKYREQLTASLDEEF